MTLTIESTQNVKEAAGLLDMYKSELNKFRLSLPEPVREDTKIEAVMGLELFGATDVESVLFTLQSFQTEGSLEDLRRMTIQKLRELVSPAPIQQLAS